MPQTAQKLTDFTVLESQKENVSSIRQGRSAAQLSERFNTSDHELTRQRLDFEKQIIEEIESVDDPLEIYLNYIGWIKNNYPQGVTRKSSGMLELLERCLRYFEADELYLNDPRYVKLWIWYIEIFYPNLEEKKDKFSHMLRQRIGSKLALFYETFSNVLWDLQYYKEAIDILQDGIVANCRPIKRIQHKCDIFKKEYVKIETMVQPQNFAADSAGTVLGHTRAEIALNGERSLDHSVNQENNRKLTIFNDENDCSLTKSNGSAQEFEYKNNGTFPSKHELKKENQKLVDPLIPGTKLKPLTNVEDQRKHQLNNTDQLYKPKISVFNDVRQTREPVYKIVAVPGGKPERIHVNYALVYPSSGEELCFEEILAKKRHALKKSVKSHKKRKILQEKMVSQTTTLPLNDETVHLKSPFKSKLESIQTSTQGVQASPTVTMFSKNAMSEIYSLFNQTGLTKETAQALAPKHEEDNTEKRFALYENFNQDFTRPLDDLTEVKMSTKNSVYQGDLAKASSIYTSPAKRISDFRNSLSPFKKVGLTPSPLKKSIASRSHLLKINIVEDPLNDSFRQHLLSLRKPLTEYGSFHQYNCDLKMSGQLSRINKTKRNENKNPIIKFQKTDEFYCIKGELGRGGFATVYLAESGDGLLKALKVETPANKWEFYILQQIKERLSHNEWALKSIVLVDSLHCFDDESYLVLNYISQGTILDLVNLARDSDNAQSFDEQLTIFFTIEIIKVLECLHDVGIIHGDLKPDNCMVRFDSSHNESLGEYNSNGLYNWDKKGIYLIDFGRSLDLTILPENTKFKANWNCDAQDCSEMRENKPWSYEADYYGLAGIIHCMLFGEFIKTAKAGNKHVLVNRFKRYWQRSLWEELFDILLNSGRYEDLQHNRKLPITNILREQRTKLETHLKENTNSSKLQNIIHGLERDIGK